MRGAKSTLTRDEAISILHDCTARNGGWLTNYAYARIPDVPSPQTMYRILGCKPATWERLCEVAGINSSFAATLPDVLSEADILRIIDMGPSRMQLVPVPHRQQIALYCMRRIYPLVGGRFMDEESYNRKAHANLLLGGSFCRAAFGTWINALKASGLPVDASRHGPCRFPRGKKADGEAGVIRCTEADLPGAEPVPANWRTMDVCLATLTPVTEVTVFRTLTPGVGLRHTEVRACIR